MASSTRKPKRIGSGNQYKDLSHPMHISKKVQNQYRRKEKRSGSHNTKQYNDVSNARKKAQRRITGMEKQLGSLSSPQERAELQGRIDALREAIESTRTYSSETGKRIRSKQEVAANLQNLERLNRASSEFVRGAAGVQARRNKFTEQMINMASIEGPTVSVYRKSQVTAFYRWTQEAWVHTDVTDINDAILDYYSEAAGTRDLANLFDWVLAQGRNSELVRALDTLNNPYATDDERDWAFDFLKTEGLEAYASGTGSINQDNPLL